jgi:hypothetical protein
MLRYRGDEMKLLPCLRSGEIEYGNALAENSSTTDQSPFDIWVSFLD